MLVDKNIIRKDSEYYSKIRHYKDLYTYYIEALKFVYKDEWQKHIGINVLKSALNGKMSDEECNKRYSRDVANLLLTDCRYKKVLERVCSRTYTGEELEEGFKQPKSKAGDAKYESMRYWEYLPEYFYEYQKRYGCTFYLDYNEPEIKKTVETMYMSKEFGVLTQNLQSEYRASMREAIADFLDDPVNKQVREQLYDDYKYYAHNCLIRLRGRSELADKIWDQGKRHNGSIEEQECYKYIKALNPYAFEKESHRIIRVAHKTGQNEMENWGVALKDAKDLACLQGKKDIYMSPNLFSKSRSYTSDDVYLLNALYVDIDYYNTKYGSFEPEAMVSKLKLLKFSGATSIPEPSLYISSGRGLYLIWLLDFQYRKEGIYDNEAYWSKVEERLVEQFKDCGADVGVKDTPRLLRLPGSLNSKTGRRVRVIKGDLDNPTRYSISEIHKSLKQVEEFQKALKSNKPLRVVAKNSAPKPSRITKGEGIGIPLKGIHGVNLNRVRDLEKVVEYRSINGCIGIGEIGWRDNLIFLYCLHLCYAGYSVDQSINRAFKLNQKMNIPLEECEITRKKNNLETARKAYFKSIQDVNGHKRYVKTKKDGAYQYKTSKIIEMIDLTEEEQANINFSTLVSEAVRRDRRKLYDAERYKRQLKEKGEKSKKDKTAEMREEVKELLAQGMTQKAIAEKLGISTKTVQRRVKELQNENIIEFQEANKPVEDRSVTADTTQEVVISKGKKEVYTDSFGMPTTTGTEKYRGFGEQTVG